MFQLITPEFIEWEQMMFDIFSREAPVRESRMPGTRAARYREFFLKRVGCVSVSMYEEIINGIEFETKEDELLFLLSYKNYLDFF